MGRRGIVQYAGSVDCREPDMAYYLVCAPKVTQDVHAEAVDGLLLVTQYDVPWRADLNLKGMRNGID